MASLPLCFVISVSMLFHKCSIAVQGRVIDANTPLEKFHETINDAGISACFGNAVGVANPSIIPDQHMAASSYYNSRYLPAYGRLNFGTAGGWCAGRSSNNEWLLVDLGQLYRVCGVATQGYDSANLWVTAFKLYYSQDGKTWTAYKDKTGNMVEFHRIGKSNGVDQHKIKRINARYILFNPTKQHGWNCLRVEVYGKTPLDQCGVKLSKRIVGGQHSSPGEWRWQVELYISAPNGALYHCSGSLLNPQWVMSAAHCVKGKDAKSIKISLGQHTRSEVSGNEQVHSVSKLIVHPQYEPLKNVPPKYDFALMKLTRPATINDHVGTICLPKSTAKLPVGTVLWQTGWGYTSQGGQTSDVLKELEIVVVSPSRNPWPVSNSEFITTATQQGHGACTGDSGGPVVTERNGLWYLEGVTSWGPSICGHPGYYNGQADVRAVLQWIKDTIKNN